jgi:hypothetical protein
MSITRRNFFRNVAAGAAAAGVLPPLGDLAFNDLVPASRASEPSGPIILSPNENAYGPSQKVIASMQDALHFANRYPDPAVNALHDRIAQSHSIKSEQLVLGCGSGEILSITASSFLGPGKTLITALPTSNPLDVAPKLWVRKSSKFLSTRIALNPRGLPRKNPISLRPPSPRRPQRRRCPRRSRCL